MPVRLDSPAEVDRVVNPLELVEEIKFILSSSDAYAPKRLGLEHSGSWLGVMPAAGLDYYVVKIVGVFPENPRHGLPLVRGRLLLFSARSGELLLDADAAAPTAWRTAAATALALRLLGLRRGNILGVIGAGVQADYHVRLLSPLYGFADIMVYDIDYSRAEKLASRHGGRAVRALDRVLEEADVIVAATTSRTPVVRGRLLRRGTFVASIGAPRPVRELDYDVIDRAGCILVDTREGVLAETDDVKGARELVEMGEVLRGEKTCSPRDIRVYKSVGTALFDLAVAIHLYRRAV